MYQIILIENSKKIKVLYTYSREYDALYRLTNLGNKKIFFPKKQVYKNKILTKVIYHVLLIKKRTEKDKSVTVRDNYGKLLESFMGDPNWVVLGKIDYNIEEQFNVTGANRKLNALEIINNVLMPNLSDKNPKQVVILNNKLIIEGITLNMVTCKDITEARRLYNKLRTYCFEEKTIPPNNIIFFGTVPKKNKRLWYKKITTLTGVSHNRLYRTSSR